MRNLRRVGFTLVELIVVIAILATLLWLIIPGIHHGGEEARSNTCRNNLKQMSMALAARENSLGKYPGYVNTLGEPEKKSVRASWAVLSFPYLEEQKLWDQWNAGNYELRAIEIFICPSDPRIDITLPHLSYVANAGYIASHQQ